MLSILHRYRRWGWGQQSSSIVWHSGVNAFPKISIGLKNNIPLTLACSNTDATLCIFFCLISKTFNLISKNTNIYIQRSERPKHAIAVEHQSLHFFKFNEFLKNVSDRYFKLLRDSLLICFEGYTLIVLVGKIKFTSFNVVHKRSHMLFFLFCLNSSNEYK